MRKLVLILVIFFLGTQLSYSQQSVFKLHEFIGDTIDLNEKKDFDLFPELKNSDFKFGIVYSYGDTKKLNVYTQNDSMIVSSLDSVLIAKYQSNIEILLDYYLTQNSNDTVNDLNKKIYLHDLKSNNINVNNSIDVDKAELEKSAYEGRRKLFLRTRALERGLTGKSVIDAQDYGGYGEINFKKKK